MRNISLVDNHFSLVLARPFNAFMNNRNANRPVYPRSLINTCVIFCLNCITDFVFNTRGRLFEINDIVCTAKDSHIFPTTNNSVFDNLVRVYLTS